MKTHTITDYRPDYIPAYLSNGVVGLRVNKIPFINSAAVVNGFVGVDPIEKVQGLAYVPYPLGGDVRVGPWWLSQRPDWITFRDQSYDFACGELRTRFDFVSEGVTARVEVLTFCSRSLPTVVVQEVRVEVDQPCGLALWAIISPQHCVGHCLHRDMATYNGRPVVDGSLEWQSPGALSRVGIAYVTEFLGDDAMQKNREEWGYKNAISTSCPLSARPGHTYIMRQYASLVPSLMHSEPDRQAIRMAYIAAERGFDTLRQENRAAWAQIWKGRVNLIGAEPRWQSMADAAYFYLHTSIHQASPNSTGLFGLGQWHNYHYFRGHIFWDIETFAFPPVLLTAPDAARAMINHRSKHLDAARANAAINGYRGIQFPWESSHFGEEVTPNGWPHIIHEQHINADVAFAFAQYVHATGDEIFLREQAWPVLHGVGEWICSRVTETERGYEILHVTGIDEGRPGVNNNSWTNCGALVVLREAIAFAVRLGYTPPRHWQQVEQRFYIPLDPATGTLSKFDGYEYCEGDICCPDSLLAFFPMTYRTNHEIEIATYKTYLDWGRSAMGYPMHSAMQGVFAARLGDRQRALQLFEDGFASYIFEPFMQIDEFAAKYTAHKEKVGPYLAHAGGFLMSCMYGLTGIQLGPGEPQSWCQFPITMPEGWDGIEIERMWVHGQPARLIARHGDERATMEMI